MVAVHCGFNFTLYRFVISGVGKVAAIVGLTADTKITDADRKRWKKEADMRERIRIEEREKIHKNAARKAQSMWRSIHQSNDCAYGTKTSAKYWMYY